MYSDTWEQHLEHLDGVFARMDKYGLQTKKSKISIAHEETKILVSQDP